MTWCKGLHKPAGSSQINLSPSPHLSYFLGALFGDGNVRKKVHNYKYQIRLRVQDKDFALLFANSASNILQKEIKLVERTILLVVGKGLWQVYVIEGCGNF